MTTRLPTHSPLNRSSLDSAFVGRVMGRKEAKRLAGIMDTAEREARDRIDLATREARDILATARAEADAILALLPDFAAIEAAPARKGKSAYAAIRAVADRHGVPIAAITGKGRDSRAKAIRGEAVRAVVDACPTMNDAAIAALFPSMAASTVRRLRTEGAS